MNILKYTTTTEEDNINDVFDKIPNKSELGLFADKETVTTFTDYRVSPGYPNPNVTTVYDLLKSKALSEVPEHLIIDILKGKSYVKKVVTTEYLIIENDGADLTKNFNDDYITYLSSDNPKELPKEKQFFNRGSMILNGVQQEKSDEEIIKDYDESRK